MSRILTLTTSGGDPWQFHGSSKQVSYSYVGKQERMAGGQLRSWRRTGSTKRVWSIQFDVLERMEKDMILLLVEETANLTFQDDLMTAGVEVQIDRESVAFTDLVSDETIYSATIRLLEV